MVAAVALGCPTRRYLVSQLPPGESGRAPSAVPAARPPSRPLWPWPAPRGDGAPCSPRDAFAGNPAASRAAALPDTSASGTPTDASPPSRPARTGSGSTGISSAGASPSGATAARPLPPVSATPRRRDRCVRALSGSGARRRPRCHGPVGPLAAAAGARRSRRWQCSTSSRPIRSVAPPASNTTSFAVSCAWRWIATPAPWRTSTARIPPTRTSSSVVPWPPTQGAAGLDAGVDTATMIREPPDRLTQPRAIGRLVLTRRFTPSGGAKCIEPAAARSTGSGTRATCPPQSKTRPVRSALPRRPHLAVELTYRGFAWQKARP